MKRRMRRRQGFVHQKQSHQLRRERRALAAILAELPMEFTVKQIVERDPGFAGGGGLKSCFDRMLGSGEITHAGSRRGIYTWVREQSPANRGLEHVPLDAVLQAGELARMKAEHPKSAHVAEDTPQSSAPAGERETGERMEMPILTQEEVKPVVSQTKRTYMAVTERLRLLYVQHGGGAITAADVLATGLKKADAFFVNAMQSGYLKRERPGRYAWSKIPPNAPKNLAFADASPPSPLEGQKPAEQVCDTAPEPAADSCITTPAASQEAAMPRTLTSLDEELVALEVEEAELARSYAELQMRLEVAAVQRDHFRCVRDAEALEQVIKLVNRLGSLSLLKFSRSLSDRQIAAMRLTRVEESKEYAPEVSEEVKNEN